MSVATNSHGRELLPANVVPRHYALTLDPNLTDFTFEGKVIIEIDVVEDTSSVSVNSHEIDIHNVRVSADGKEVRYVNTPLRTTIANIGDDVLTEHSFKAQMLKLPTKSQSRQLHFPSLAKSGRETRRSSRSHSQAS
jgi:aminopeptidase 2